MSLWPVVVLLLLFCLNSSVLASSANDLLAKVRSAHWIGEGQGDHVVYVIFDPNCPYCHLLYKESLAHLKHFQFRWIPVGILSSTSSGKAAAILAANHPLAALRTNEVGFTRGRGERGGAIKPLKSVTSDTYWDLQDNRDVLDDTGVEVVPKIIFADKGDKPRVITGALSANDLSDVLKGIPSTLPARNGYPEYAARTLADNSLPPSQ